jgi:hypothetical protein
MTNDTFKDIEKLETDIREAADNLRGIPSSPPATTSCPCWA